MRRHGKGTYVAEQRIEQDLVRLTDFVEDMHLAGLVSSSRELAFVHEAANPHVAEALNLSIDEEVVYVDRLRLANDLPIAYDTTWLPLRFGMLLHFQVVIGRPTCYSHLPGNVSDIGLLLTKVMNAMIQFDALLQAISPPLLLLGWLDDPKNIPSNSSWLY
ncbi:MAG: hypothetical protein NVS4B12_26230 [Ktedonobacteraceae bacterium]